MSFAMPFPPRAASVLAFICAASLSLGAGTSSSDGPTRAGDGKVAIATGNLEALPLPRSPEDSRAAIKTRENLAVDLVVAEPLVESPVAIDWSADGRLWVAEMRDYPLGSDGHYKAGGVVRVLEDTDHDGRYDKATVFLDGLPFPTGVTAWGRGVLICAAPDIIYAEDTNGDGRADVVKQLFTGFATDNYQARVNSLALGLDNWIHGANGLLGGEIRSFSGGPSVDIRGRDFRFKPESGEFEAVAGLTQQGRCRNDADEWFGCSNSALIYHFPMPERYLRRNPHVPAPPSRANIPADAEPNHLYPISVTLERFNHPSAVNETTSACGLGLYRDDLIGELEGDAFTCEPVHNLVHRLNLVRKGVTFEARRAKDEQTSEFLASSDNWFRPVQVRTGPDGALWIVDMYRAVIEHPRWIPGDKLAKLDVRAGAEMGRIYRVHSRTEKLRAIVDLTRLDTPQLVAALDTPNGTTRDLVHQQLLQRGDPSAAALLVTLLQKGAVPAARVQALCVLDGLNATTPEILCAALRDPMPELRCQALRIGERRLASSPKLASACLALKDDPELRVRYQLALSLGEWADPRAADALISIALSAPDDVWMRAALLSSANRQALPILHGVIASAADTPGFAELIGGLVSTAAATVRAEELRNVLETVAPVDGGRIQGWQVVALLRLQDALDRRKISLQSLLDSADPRAATQLRRVADAASNFAESNADPSVRSAAVRLLGRSIGEADSQLPELARYLRPETEAALQTAALDALARSRSPEVPRILLEEWSQHGPATRASIVNVLLGRDEWALAFLEAIEQHRVSPGDLPAAQRERLRQSQNATIHQRAGAILPASRSADRAAVIERYRSTESLAGDAAKGAVVFKNICATCHSYLGNGNEVGPNIGTYRTKAVQDFLVAILDPNAVVEPRFAAYTVELRDGRSLYGVISSESGNTLVLTQPGGLRESLLRSDVVALRASALSLMPEGLEQAINPQEMADLISYLKGGGY
jgi:putative membrane-bound dehydrogenase-like protein